MKPLKLTFEILPVGAFNNNLRTLFSKKAWDFLRKDAYFRANGKCSICGREVKRLEAHEKWQFNLQTHTQKLTDIIAVCSLCHSVIHIGRTQLVGKEDVAIKHFKYVNKCDFTAYTSELNRVITQNKELDKISDWNLDLTFLQRYIDQNKP